MILDDVSHSLAHGKVMWRHKERDNRGKQTYRTNLHVWHLPSEQKEMHLCYQRWNYMQALVNTNRCIFFLSYYINLKILDNSIIPKFSNPKTFFSWILNIRLCWINSYAFVVNNLPCITKGQLIRSSNGHGHLLSNIQFLIYALLIFSTS